jgi:hypothetical protein
MVSSPLAPVDAVRITIMMEAVVSNGGLRTFGLKPRLIPG